MGEKTTLKLLVKGNADIVNATMSRADGGAKLTTGIRELITDQYPQIDVTATAEPSHGFQATRAEIAAGTSLVTDADVDIVILSLAEDAHTLSNRGASPEEALHAVREDIVAVIDGIKATTEARVLIANVSTIDPNDRTFDYHGLPEEPLSLRAQRLDLLLVGISHSEGASIIDVDRLIAELGAADHVAGAFDYSATACGRIATEAVRVLEDYGFFDDRPLLEQVGAGSS